MTLHSSAAEERGHSRSAFLDGLLLGLIYARDVQCSNNNMTAYDVPAFVWELSSLLMIPSTRFDLLHALPLLP